MFTLKQKSTGFTVVELLIVIVVIAILATISVVAYTGIQRRARISTVKSETNVFLKQAEIFKIDSPTSRYPSSDISFKQVLVSSNLWEITRNGSNRTFVYCSTSNAMAMVSWNYIEPVADGITLYYVSSTDGQQTVVYDVSIPASAVSERVCSQVLPSSTYRQWAHNLT